MAKLVSALRGVEAELMTDHTVPPPLAGAVASVLEMVVGVLAREALADHPDQAIAA